VLEGLPVALAVDARDDVLAAVGRPFDVKGTAAKGTATTRPRRLSRPTPTGMVRMESSFRMPLVLPPSPASVKCSQPTPPKRNGATSIWPVTTGAARRSAPSRPFDMSAAPSSMP
jgi:hypothetical protein